MFAEQARKSRLNLLVIYLQFIFNNFLSINICHQRDLMRVYCAPVVENSENKLIRILVSRLLNLTESTSFPYDLSRNSYSVNKCLYLWNENKISVCLTELKYNICGCNHS